MVLFIHIDIPVDCFAALTMTRFLSSQGGTLRRSIALREMIGFYDFSPLFFCDCSHNFGRMWASAPTPLVIILHSGLYVDCFAALAMTGLFFLVGCACNITAFQFDQMRDAGDAFALHDRRRRQQSPGRTEQHIMKRAVFKTVHDIGRQH